MTSALNLMVPAMAGATAFAALGVAFASHAFGAWAGALAGAAEVQRRLLEGVAERPDERPAPDASEPRERPHLKLVSSTEGPESARRTRRPAAPRKPAVRQTDDLKAISGIGPKLEKVLNERGIRTYAQIAGLNEKDIAGLDAELGVGARIERDDWIGQARRLTTRAG